MRASRPRCSSRRAGVRPPSDGESGRWPTGRSPASRSSTARSSGVQLGQRGRQVGGQLDPQLGGPAAQTRRVADGAAHRVGGAQDVVAPQQRAGGRAAPARAASDVVGHVGQRRDQVVGGDAVGRGEQHDVEHLQRRRVQLVERAVDRHRDGEPAGQRHDVGRRRAGDVGTGRQQGAQLLVAAGAQPGGERRRRVRGHPVHATSSPQATLLPAWRRAPAGETPRPGPPWTRYQAGALRWLAGGVDRRRPRRPARGRGRGGRRAAAGGCPGVGLVVVVLVAGRD